MYTKGAASSVMLKDFSFGLFLPVFPQLRNETKKIKKLESNYIKENPKIVSVHVYVRAPRPQF